MTVDPGEFLDSSKDKKKEKVNKKKDLKKREDLYQYAVLTPDAKNKCLRAFRVTVPAKTEHPKVNYQHNGEELIYVLNGEIDVMVGQKKYHLKKDETVLFNSGVKHSLKNRSKKDTILLVTVYTPKG